MEGVHDCPIQYFQLMFQILSEVSTVEHHSCYLYLTSYDKNITSYRQPKQLMHMWYVDKRYVWREQPGLVT